MKKVLINFLKNKFNLSIFILQSFAIISLILSYLWDIMLLFFLVAEGGVFIALGIKYFYSNKLITKQIECYNSMNVEESDLEAFNKKQKIIKKGNVLQGVLFICMGLILIFVALF